MSEFEEYLSRIRAALDLNPKRADEILAEVRSHLEAQAAELERGGLPRDEAAAEAIRSFGEPGEMARSLRRANGRHRRPSAARVVLALGLATAAMIIPFAAQGVWDDPYRRLVAPAFDLANPAAAVFVVLFFVGPSAPLLGLLAGRRRWWAPGAPAVGWSLLYWGLMATDGSTTWHHPGADAVAALFLLPLCVAPLLAALGWAGFCLASTRARGAIVAVGVVWLALQTVVGCASLVDPISILAIISVTESVLLLAALTILWNHRPHTLPVLRVGAIGLALFIALMVLGDGVVYDRVFGYEATPAGIGPHLGLWALIAVGQGTLLLRLGLLARRLGQERAADADERAW